LNISQAVQTTIEDLYSRHTKQILDNMEGSYQNWTIYSVEQLIFDSLLSRAGKLIDLLAIAEFNCKLFKFALVLLCD